LPRLHPGAVFGVAINSVSHRGDVDPVGARERGREADGVTADESTIGAVSARAVAAESVESLERQLATMWTPSRWATDAEGFHPAGADIQFEI
jgi:hypothetical protein